MFTVFLFVFLLCNRRSSSAVAVANGAQISSLQDVGGVVGGAMQGSREAIVRLEAAIHLALVSQNYLGAAQDLLCLCQLLRCYLTSLN